MSLNNFIKLTIGMVLIVGLIGGILYTDSIISSESLYPRPGTYAYWVAVPALMKSLPKPQLMGQAIYYHTAGDGTKVPEDEVSFLSTATKEIIFQEIEDYLIAYGLKKLDANAETQTYVLDDSLVEVKIKLNNEGYNKIIILKSY